MSRTKREQTSADEPYSLPGLVPTQQEADRLTQVYRSYRENEAIQARWVEDNPGNWAILCERQQRTRKMLGGYPRFLLSECKVLEVGCGAGKVLASLAEMGVRPENLYGVDLLSERIREVQQRYPDLHFQCGNAETLDFSDTHFDLVLLFTVFSSILSNDMARQVAGEVNRVLKPGGAILWYDFRYNNPANPHVQGITKYLFKNFSLVLRCTCAPLLCFHRWPAGLDA